MKTKITPVHPNLLLERRMTAEEMLEAVKYEGMFGIGWRDLLAALELKSKGLILLEYWDNNRGWHVCDAR